MESVLYEAVNNVDNENNDSCEKVTVQEPLIDENSLPLVPAGVREFSRLPERSPIDMRFENVTFTASMGWRKGERYK